MFPKKIHTYIYITGLCILATGLPISPFLLSVALITLMVNWLLQANYREKWKLINTRKSVWVISVFYLVYLTGLIYSSDKDWGLHDLRIILPMLVLPLVIGTSQDISIKHLKWILYCFTGSLLIHSILCIYLFLQLNHISDHSLAETTNFIDSIRLSLMVNMSIFTLLWLYSNTAEKIKWLYIPLIIWLILFLFLLKSFTGIIIFILVSFILILRSAFISKNRWFKFYIFLGAVLLILIPGIYFINAYEKFISKEKVNPSTIDRITKYGNQYQHDFNDKSIENGHYINLYFCEPELRSEWNKRSKLSYDSFNYLNQYLKYPLIRYLTSKGLRKDKDGVDQLTGKDIKNIEWGMTNYIFENKFSIYPRLYTAFWELYNYHHGANPTGYSISTRIEALRNGVHIIKKNFWIGVGTGDEFKAVEKQYKEDNSRLSEERRIVPHDQWVTFFMTFGLIGFIIIIWALFMPIFIEHKFRDYLFILIMLIGFLSFFDEDTLNTHVGVSFFAFFYSLFLFWKNPVNDKT